ncbi:MAG: TetR/AcrR family transcriptional regulator, partial [Caulobacteraceae bacterium]
MTLADVADDLHISKPTLYYYFESKEQILFEIQRLAIAMLNESGPLDGERDALAEGRASDRLARFIARYVKM